MALLKKKKPKPKLMAPLTMEQQLELAPGAPVIPGTNWETIINADPTFEQNFGDIAAEGISDKAGTMAALRQALIRMGGAGLAGVVGKLGGGWADLLDPTTLEAARAGDTAGTSVSSQLAKEHAARNLGLQDLLASQGNFSSGQTGFELGEERQRNTIAGSSAIDSLLQALQGGIGQFAGREGDRNARRAAERQAAADRAVALGLSPTPPRVQAPPTTPALVRQLRRNARRPIRRTIGGV